MEILWYLWDRFGGGKRDIGDHACAVGDIGRAFA